MKLLLAATSIFLLSFTIHWESDFSKAKEKASSEHKYILLNFSGSDWCVPCIRMHKEILGDTTFTAFADGCLVLVNADFPRKKKNLPSKEIQKQNEALADKYNPNGNFPFTLLLDADGKVIKTWDGFPAKDAASFKEEISNTIHAGK